METFAAAILAGGASRRMGTPKALLPFSPTEKKDGVEQQNEVIAAPLIAHIADVLRPLFRSVVVITSSPQIAAACDLPQVEDRFSGKGPMAGIHAALSHFNARDDFSNANPNASVNTSANANPAASKKGSSQTPVFCVACDMPHLRADFIAYLLEQWRDCDAVVPRLGVYDEPLHALYGSACLPRIERELERDHVGPIDNIFRDLRVRWVEESEARRFDPDLRLFDNWNTPDDVKKSRGQ